MEEMEGEIDEDKENRNGNGDRDEDEWRHIDAGLADKSIVLLQQWYNVCVYFHG